jgi:CRP-like cAMP-binding protein
VETLKGYLEKKEAKRGEYLIRQGERTRHLFFVESGEFEVRYEMKDKAPMRLRTMRAGVVFGEIALYLDIPRSVSVIASKSSAYYRLSAERLREMEQKEPAVALTFQTFMIRTLSERLVDLNRTLHAMSQ